MWISWLMVFIGGGLGSLCRYGIGLLLKNKAGTLPLGTLMANIISCILLGFLIGWVAKNHLSSPMALLWMTGFCGGFSTFSTFSAESWQLIQQGQIELALLNIGGSVLIGLGCIFVGLKMSGL